MDFMSILYRLIEQGVSRQKAIGEKELEINVKTAKEAIGRADRAAERRAKQNLVVIDADKQKEETRTRIKLE